MSLNLRLFLLFMVSYSLLFSQNQSIAETEFPPYSDSLNTVIKTYIYVLDSIADNDFLDQTMAASEPIIELSGITKIEGGINWGYFGPDSFTLEQLKKWKDWYKEWIDATIEIE